MMQQIKILPCSNTQLACNRGQTSPASATSTMLAAPTPTATGPAHEPSATLCMQACVNMPIGAMSSLGERPTLVGSRRCRAYESLRRATRAPVVTFVMSMSCNKP